MKLIHLILIVSATTLLSGGVGFLFGTVIGKTTWTIGDGVPIGVCLTTEIAKNQGVMTQAEVDKVLNQARDRVQKSANRIIPTAEFNFNCQETLGNFLK